MRTLYILANDFWTGAKWAWSTIVVTILVGVLISVFAGSQADVVNTTAAVIIHWLRELGFYQELIFGNFVQISDTRHKRTRDLQKVVMVLYEVGLG